MRRPIAGLPRTLEGRGMENVLFGEARERIPYEERERGACEGGGGAH